MHCCASVLRWARGITGRPKILVIVGAAVCALLIAAANFAGLLLARVIERLGQG